MNMIANEAKLRGPLGRLRLMCKVRHRGHLRVQRLVISVVAVALVTSAGASTATATGWNAPQAVPGIAGYQQTGVSCTAASFCVSVGHSPGLNAQAVTAEIWNGSTWTSGSVAQPNLEAPAVFEGASCVDTRKSSTGAPTAPVCYAVGDYFSGGAETALIEFFNGSSWSIQSPQLPSGTTFSSLSGVSCASEDFCVAVGTFRTASGESTLEEVWNGSAWTPSAQTVANARLDAVSCTSSSFCAAVGAGPTGDLAEVYNGSAWTVQTGAALTGHGPSGELTSVSCTSPTACVAVGVYHGNGVLAQAAIYGGTSWSANDPASPGLTDSALGGVSCSPTSNGPVTCWAVGVYDSSGGQDNDWGEYWNGSSWQFASLPNPPSGTSPSLAAVSCPAQSLAGFCTAVGDSTSSSGPVGFTDIYTAVVVLPPRCCRQLTPKSFSLRAHGAEKRGVTITAVLRKPRVLVLLVREQLRHRLVTVGVVPLGRHRAGRSEIHWNLLVNGRPLHAGRYQVSLHSDTNDILSPPTPPGVRTLTISANGQLRVGG